MFTSGKGHASWPSEAERLGQPYGTPFVTKLKVAYGYYVRLRGIFHFASLGARFSLLTFYVVQLTTIRFVMYLLVL